MDINASESVVKKNTDSLNTTKQMFVTLHNILTS